MANGNRNDGMDALGALIGLSFLGTMAGDTAKDEVPQFIKELQRQTASGRSSAKPSPIDGAKAAREIFEAYLEVGFESEQAFELLKLILTIKR